MTKNTYNPMTVIIDRIIRVVQCFRLGHLPGLGVCGSQRCQHCGTVLPHYERRF